MGISHNVKVLPHEKYARIECERRFLLREFPAGIQPIQIRRIADRYLIGTSLRLRMLAEDGQPPVYKLTQKIPQPSGISQQGWITSIYLTAREYGLLALLPGHPLVKTRYGVPPFGIDVFEGALEGLVMAEAEFESEAAACALVLPAFVLREVTSDPRFTGGQLAEHGRPAPGP